MLLTYNSAKRTLIAAIDGDIDHHSAALLRQQIDHEFRKTKAINIVFDFSRLKFMDSSGIGLIMGRYKLIRPLNGKVILAGVSTQLDRLISISGVYKLAGWATDVDEALRTLTEKAR